MENKNVDKFLPIGSVVLLKDATKRLMITGYCLITRENVDKVYDYSGCVYPEGIITSNQIALFNHDQIETIYAKGYLDAEAEEHLKKLVEATKESNNG